MHTLLDLRGSIPTFTFITDGKYHDSNALDVIIPIPDAIYLMDKSYVDFVALYRIHLASAYFVTIAKTSMRYEIIEQNFNINKNTGLRSDKTVVLTSTKSKKLYPEKLRLVDFYDCEIDNYLVFQSNNFEVTALEIANLYKTDGALKCFSNG